MKYNKPYGAAGADDPYINGDPSVGRAGSIPPAESIEYPQREIVEVITDAGFTPANTDLKQLARAIQNSRLLFGIDTGVQSILTANLSPAPLAYYDGMTVVIRAASDNRGPSTLNLNSLGGVPIVRTDGSPLLDKDITAGSIDSYRFDNVLNKFILLTGAAGVGSNLRPGLPANTTLFVNTSTGNDSTLDGTAATITGTHGPFKTITRAITETFKYGPSNFTMTIQVAAGTYAEFVHTPTFSGPAVVINGAGIATTFVTGANDNHTFAANGPNDMTVKNITGSGGTGAGPPCIFAAQGAGATIRTDTTASASTGGAVFLAFTLGNLVIAGNHTFNVSTVLYDFWASSSGNISFLAGTTLNWSGAHTVTNCAYASSLGAMLVANPSPPTISNGGNVTGKRYQASLNGVINSQGQGATYFPGTIAGTLDNGGQYA